MRCADWPMTYWASSSTHAATVSARPSTIGSPHPTIPSLVVIFRNSHRGGTLNNSSFSIINLSSICISLRIIIHYRTQKPVDRLRNSRGLASHDRTANTDSRNPRMEPVQRVGLIDTTDRKEAGSTEWTKKRLEVIDAQSSGRE